MKLHTIYLLVILSLTSCVTTTNVHYSDPNYLNSDEFSTYQEITRNTQQEETSNSDTTIHDKSNNYITDNNTKRQKTHDTESDELQKIYDARKDLESKNILGSTRRNA